MSISFSSRTLLVVLTAFAIMNAVAAFMCYTKTIGEDDTSVAFCSSSTCYSKGGSVGNSKDAMKGCSEEPHEDGCMETGIPGIASAHICYCSTPLCNSAFTPSNVLPLLVLPAMLQYFL
ncbi:uncharacterized protein LOC135115236 [Scylla paramamosain]|uniref:uncharacterized protein LOC135115236 n=1 Tax=Scylla paramamosain TaxID=85552 RepID=UPI003083D1F5